MKSKIIHIGLFFLMVSCFQKKEIIVDEKLSDTDMPIVANIVFDGENLAYKMNTIQLKEKDKNGDYLIQEINQKRGDIFFKAKKINTKFYLANKGLTGAELKEALADLKNEQLYFIEFNEFQKQDLMKKYFNGNMDQSVSYMSFDINKDFQIINAENDTIESSYSIYERNYHVAPFERILVSFSNLLPDEELNLVYTDRLFKKGKMNFDFPSQNYIIKNTQIAL